jgi:hypothetical protein
VRTVPNRFATRVASTSRLRHGSVGSAACAGSVGRLGPATAARSVGSACLAARTVRCATGARLVGWLHAAPGFAHAAAVRTVGVGALEPRSVIGIFAGALVLRRDRRTSCAGAAALEMCVVTAAHAVAAQPDVKAAQHPGARLRLRRRRGGAIVLRGARRSTIAGGSTLSTLSAAFTSVTRCACLARACAARSRARAAALARVARAGGRSPATTRATADAGATALARATTAHVRAAATGAARAAATAAARRATRAVVVESAVALAVTSRRPNGGNTQQSDR